MKVLESYKQNIKHRYGILWIWDIFASGHDVIAKTLAIQWERKQQAVYLKFTWMIYKYPDPVSF